MQKRILVTRSSMPPMEEYIEEIKDIWESHWLTNMGGKYRKLQEEVRSYLGVDQMELIVNGHMALELALQMMELEGEVITTPFTFVSTTHAIVRSGLTPVFCDIDPETYTMDPARIEELITDKTCAIMPVHVYGNICHVDEIQRIARKYGLKVIYDTAHAFGEMYQEKGIGCYGDAACFSFHATKVFNTVEGGAVCFGDEKFGRTLRYLKNFGIQGPEKIAGIGTNAKMNEFCAAMGICNLRHVDEEINRRKKVSERYYEKLKGYKGLQLPRVQKDVKPNYAYFPIVVEEKLFGADRDRIYDCLNSNGIGSRKYFYPLTSKCDCYQGKYRMQETPVAEYVSDHVLSLPIYADLLLEEVDRICNIILETKQGQSRGGVSYG